MTTEIPDDVVGRAIDAMSARPVLEAPMSRMRAALRVAVEWEREQCARLIEQFGTRHYDVDETAGRIRARSRKD